ncbi:MAG: ABC transporter permease subunit, partial [Nitrososphaerota archaeon]
TGAFLVEWIFVYPGIGALFVNAIGLLDFNVIQGIIMLTMFTVLTANLIMDLIYPLIDPRVALT